MVHVFVLYLCVFTFGVSHTVGPICVYELTMPIVLVQYDGSLLNGLQTLPQWQTYFNHPAGQQLGLISASFYFREFEESPSHARTSTAQVLSQDRDSRNRLVDRGPLRSTMVSTRWLGDFGGRRARSDLCERSRNVHGRAGDARWGSRVPSHDRAASYRRDLSPGESYVSANIAWPG